MVRSTILACTLLATAGCYWGTRPLDDPAPASRVPVWIWHADTVEKWHAVRVTLDSVSGIPYRMSVKCDSCRVSLPRYRVDSINAGYQTRVQRGFEFAGALVLFVGMDAGVCRIIAPSEKQCH